MSQQVYQNGWNSQIIWILFMLKQLLHILWNLCDFEDQGGLPSIIIPVAGPKQWPKRLKQSNNMDFIYFIYF